MSDADILGGPYEPPRPPYPGPPQVKGRGRAVAGVLLALLAVACLVAVAVSAVRISREMTRKPTQAELDRAAAVELARRWQEWPAGKIFPDTLTYNADVGGDEKAARIGIDPSLSCSAGLDPKARPIAAQHGCVALLRATYVDQLQGLIVTIGLIAFPDEASAQAVRRSMPAGNAISPGVSAYGPADTVAARFDDGARQTGSVQQAGPYVVALTVGYTDGRPAAAVTQRQTDLYDLASQLISPVLGPISKKAVPDCGQKEWRC